jgi:mRNA-degrading endonuclease RelE of RelBE toxin-antitoxin system
MDVRYADEARHQVDNLEPTIEARVLKVAKRLKSWPNVSGIGRLHGEWAGHCRIQTGDYRVIFTVEGDVVWIVRIMHRSENYEV